MYILDTDHMSVLERGGTPALTLTLKVSAIPDSELATTIISYEEQCKGWLAKTTKEKNEALIRVYVQFGQHLQIYASMNVLLYDERAHAVFLALRSQNIRTGTQDLKIASIALANSATLLTRNIRDFARVPNLRYEDWTV